MKPTYYECGICSQLHPATWDGDCRDDTNRFNVEDLDALHGMSGWEEIDMGDVDEWRQIEGVDIAPHASRFLPS